MSGTKEGGRKAAATNKEKHGPDFYSKIGKKGGSKSHPETRPFSKNPALASTAGKKGGQISKRGSAKTTPKKKMPKQVKTVEEPIKRKGILGWFSGRKSK